MRSVIPDYLSEIEAAIDRWTPDVAREFIDSLPDDDTVEMGDPDNTLIIRYLRSLLDEENYPELCTWYGVSQVACRARAWAYNRPFEVPRWYRRMWEYQYDHVAYSESAMDKKGLLGMIGWLEKK